MKIKHAKNFEINIPDALDTIEDDLRKYPEQLGLTGEQIEELDTPVFWGHFWKALCEHALDIYEADMEEGDEDFQFTTGVTLDELEERNPFFAPNIMDLNP